jgi:hypothetical protein
MDTGQNFAVPLIEIDPSGINFDGHALTGPREDYDISWLGRIVYLIMFMAGSNHNANPLGRPSRVFTRRVCQDRAPPPSLAEKQRCGFANGPFHSTHCLRWALLHGNVADDHHFECHVDLPFLERQICQ